MVLVLLEVLVLKLLLQIPLHQILLPHQTPRLLLFSLLVWILLEDYLHPLELDWFEEVLK